MSDIAGLPLATTLTLGQHDFVQAHTIRQISRQLTATRETVLIERRSQPFNLQTAKLALGQHKR